MREIIFRGKLLHSSEWVDGNLIIAKNGQPYIIPFEIFEPDGHHLIIDSDNPFWVIPETVSQFTGLCDKNGVKIFEHDVVEMWGKNHEIKFMNGAFEFIKSDCKKQNLIDTTVCKVIGNIHDNKELIC